MPTPRETLAQHEQHYQNSCAASGMELVLKLHGLESSSFRALQDRYRDTNIGFEKLSDLLQWGVDAKDHEPTVDIGFAKLEEDARSGLFPLVSLPSGKAWHIWVAVIEGDKVRFLSRGFNNPNILELPDSPALRHAVATYRNGKVHFATYRLKAK